MGFEFFEFGDLVVGGGQVDVGVVDGSLEFSVFGIELFDSGNVLSDGGVFVSVGLVEGIDDVFSEFVEGSDDFAEDVLVGEVLGETELDEGFDHGSLADLGEGLEVDLGDGLLDLLGLDQGGVGDGGQQGEGFIDGSDGVLVFFDDDEVFFVFLLSVQVLFGEVLSVGGGVLFDGLDLVLQLLSSGV